MEIKTDRITILKELLVTQMNHWMLFPLYVVLVFEIRNLTGIGTPHILLWLALGVFPFLLYFSRCILRKFWALALSHVAVIFLMLCIPAENLSVRILHLCIGIYYVAISCYLWTATTHLQDFKFYPIFAVVLSTAMLFFLHYREITEWDMAYITVLIIVLAMYFIIYYIEQYQDFLTVNNSSAGHIPALEMFRSGIGLVLGYTGIGSVILILVSNINWLKGIIDVIKKMLIFFLTTIITLLFRNAEPLPERATQESSAAVENVPTTDHLNTFWFWEVLEVLLLSVLMVLLIYGIIRAIMFVVKFIKNRLKSLHLSVQDSSDVSVLDVREKCAIAKNREWKVSLPFLQLTSKDRIRHLYKKRLLSSRNTFKQDCDPGLLNKFTARESGRILELDELAPIYEKARYSNMECTGDDVKRMRNTCK